MSIKIYAMSDSREVLIEQLSQSTLDIEILQNDIPHDNPHAMANEARELIREADVVLGMIGEQDSYAAAREHEFAVTGDYTAVVIWEPRGYQLSNWKLAGVDFTSPYLEDCLQYIEELVEHQEANEILEEAATGGIGIDHNTTVPDE